MTPIEARDIPVTYGFATYTARRVDAERWNGWLAPRFTREIADQIAGDCAALHAQAPHPSDELVTWDEERQAYLVISEEQEADGYGPLIVRGEPDVDGTPLYPIGAWTWTWQQVARPGDAPAGSVPATAAPID